MNHKLHILDQTEKICSSNGMLKGAMIGWWYGISEGRSVPKKLKKLESIDSIDHVRTAQEPRWLVEQMRNHIFWYLIDQIRRQGKNEHVIHTTRDAKIGPEATLLAVDLDRADFDSRDKVSSMSFSQVCMFDRKTFDSISNAAAFGDLGETLRQTLLYDPSGLVGMTKRQAHRLDWRIRQTKKAFDACIERFGFDNVVVDV